MINANYEEDENVRKEVDEKLEVGRILNDLGNRMPLDKFYDILLNLGIPSTNISFLYSDNVDYSNMFSYLGSWKPISTADVFDDINLYWINTVAVSLFSEEFTVVISLNKYNSQ